MVMTTVDATQSNPTTYIELDDDKPVAAPPPPPPPPNTEPDFTLFDAQGKGSECLLRAGRPSVYVGPIAPDDVKQYDKADCTLMATLASLARTPAGQQWIRNHIRSDRDPQGNEIWHVTLHTELAVMGPLVKIDVTVGTCDLTRDPEGAPAWPRIFEAAMLKANKEQPWGSARCSFEMLVGRTSEDLSPSADQFESRLAAGFERGMVQVLSTLAPPPGSRVADLHAYTVLDVKKDAQGHISQVKLQNPWGMTPPRILWMSIADVKRTFAGFTQGSVT